MEPADKRTKRVSRSSSVLCRAARSRGKVNATFRRMQHLCVETITEIIMQYCHSFGPWLLLNAFDAKMLYLSHLQEPINGEHQGPAVLLQDPRTWQTIRNCVGGITRAQAERIGPQTQGCWWPSGPAFWTQADYNSNNLCYLDSFFKNEVSGLHSSAIIPVRLRLCSGFWTERFRISTSWGVS